MIDTLRYTRELEATGLTREQAEIFVRSHLGMISDNVATKAEIDKLETNLSRRMDQLDTKFTGQIGRLDGQIGRLDGQVGQLDGKIDQLETRLTLKLTGIMAVLLAIFSGFGGLFAS